MAKSNNSNGNKQSGGSTLKRLKSNLKSLGLIGKQKISKRKHAKLAKGEKEERVAKLKKLQDQVNPFELKFNRKKHEVLGRKEKGVVGKPGASRKTGIEVVSIFSNYEALMYDC